MECNNCGRFMELQCWKPNAGLEPKLRLFKCPSCTWEIYKIPSGLEGGRQKQDELRKLGHNEILALLQTHQDVK